MASANEDVAAVLREYADLLVITGGDQFRSRNYEKAAKVVAGYPGDLAAVPDGALTTIPPARDRAEHRGRRLRGLGRGLPRGVRHVRRLGPFQLRPGPRGDDAPVRRGGAEPARARHRAPAHPQARPPADVDLEALFEACARTGTALEINASPARMDLPPEHLAAARDAGAKFAIDTDAHSIGDLDSARYGIAAARLAGLTPDDVINAWPLDRLREFLAKGRSPQKLPASSM